MTEVKLVDFTPSNEKQLTEQVLNTYSKNYGDVDSSMIQQILQSNKTKRDEFGYMTLRKELKLIIHNKKEVGFTTLTWKRGGSVKTGPTILHPDSQGKGIGPLTQLAIQDYVLKNGGRKTYGTTSTGNLRALNYMLRSGYRVEAHLEKHYHAVNDELIVGRLLRPVSIKKKFKSYSKGTDEVKITLATDYIFKKFSKELLNLINNDLVKTDSSLLKNLERCSVFPLSDFSKKPKRCYLLLEGESLLGAIILIPKRGGAVKVNVLGRVREIDIHNVVNTKLFTGDFQYRKISIFISDIHRDLRRSLLEKEWKREGQLESPYIEGVDLTVVSKVIHE
jgi:RimJ/RimL family protein N-acetyltransferase